MIAANIIGAAVGAITPIIAEIIRSKPDPEVAKRQIMSNRDEMIARAIGEGQSQATATKAVDAEIASAISQAEKEGSFNFPGGEVLSMALLGAAVPWAAGKIGGAVKGAAAAGKLGSKAKALATKPVSNTASTAEGIAKVDTPVEQAAVAKGVPKVGMDEAEAMAAQKVGRPAEMREEILEDLERGKPFPSTTKAELEMEFAGSKPAGRVMETASRDTVQAPFPGAANRPQTIYDEFQMTPPYNEAAMQAEFGPGLDLADKVWKRMRLRQPFGD